MLQNYLKVAFWTEITGGVFLAAVSFQATKAALTNPVEVLKYE